MLPAFKAYAKPPAILETIWTVMMPSAGHPWPHPLSFEVR
jgi:hypothetical protein